MGYRIGIDVGGTKIAYGLFDPAGKIIARNKVPNDRDALPQAFVDRVAADVDTLLAQNNLTRAQLEGVGIGLPSYIDYQRGYVMITSNMPNLKEFAARDAFEKKLGVTVRLDNDANVAALAEHRHGAGRGFEHMLYCAVSTGIANGIIINNQLFRGSYGAAGESGHAIITIDDGLTCGCLNQGCFMSHCSGAMIIRHIQQKIAQGEKSCMTDLAGSSGQITCEHLLQAYQMNDPLAIWAVDKMAKYLGVWVFDLYQILNINCYVFGGGLVHFGDLLFDKVKQVFWQYNRQNNLPVHFKFAELGDDFGIIGAAELLEG